MPRLLNRLDQRAPASDLLHEGLEESVLNKDSPVSSIGTKPTGHHLMSVEQLLRAAEGAAQVCGGDGQQPAPQPGHLLLQVSEELEQNLPGLQEVPAALQGLRKAVVPKCRGGGGEKSIKKLDLDSGPGLGAVGLRPVDEVSHSGLDLISEEVPLGVEVLGRFHQGLTDPNKRTLRLLLQHSTKMEPLDLDPVSVPVQLLLQALQSLQQPADGGQVGPTVLIGQLLLHQHHRLLHVVQRALELQRLHNNPTLVTGTPSRPPSPGLEGRLSIRRSTWWAS